MSRLDNPTGLNPAFFRDEPQTFIKENGLLGVVFYSNDDQEFPCLIPFEIDGIDFTVDCSQIKDVWESGFRDDLVHAIDKHHGNFFLSKRDLNLNVIGL